MNKILIKNNEKEVIASIELTANNAYTREDFSVALKDEKYRESVRTFLRFLTSALGAGSIYQEDKTPDLVCHGSYADIANSLETPHMKIVLDREKLSIKLPPVVDRAFLEPNLPSPTTKHGKMIVI